MDILGHMDTFLVVSYIDVQTSENRSQSYIKSFGFYTVCGIVNDLPTQNSCVRKINPFIPGNP